METQLIELLRQGATETAKTAFELSEIKSRLSTLEDTAKASDTKLGAMLEIDRKREAREEAAEERARTAAEARATWFRGVFFEKAVVPIIAVIVTLVTSFTAYHFGSATVVQPASAQTGAP
jgi:hypothetical protein